LSMTREGRKLRAVLELFQGKACKQRGRKKNKPMGGGLRVAGPKNTAKGEKKKERSPFSSKGKHRAPPLFINFRAGSLKGERPVKE